MLSTKDVQSVGGGVKKTLQPGNHTVRIYDLELAVPVYNSAAYQLKLFVEGPDMGPEFDGFSKDRNNPNGAKFAGQVGRVRLSPYDFADKTFDDGRKISRDTDMLRAIDSLAIACGVQDEVKTISAQDWPDMITQVKRLLIGKKISVCLGAKEYKNKSGYTELDLFLPKAADRKYSHTAVGDLNIMTYNEATHLIKDKAAPTVQAFEPVASNDDFNF